MRTILDCDEVLNYLETGAADMADCDRTEGGQFGDINLLETTAPAFWAGMDQADSRYIFGMTSEQCHATLQNPHDENSEDLLVRARAVAFELGFSKGYTDCRDADASTSVHVKRQAKASNKPIILPPAKVGKYARTTRRARANLTAFIGKLNNMPTIDADIED